MAKKVTENKLKGKSPWATALRLLTGRDYSRAELRQRLLARGCEATEVEAALERCSELDYLNDARYAANRARSLMTQGRAVGAKVLRDLKQRGVSDELAQQALAETRDEHPETELLAALIQQRFSEFDYASAPAKERRRVVHFLQRRGFGLDTIMQQLTQERL